MTKISKIHAPHLLDPPFNMQHHAGGAEVPSAVDARRRLHVAIVDEEIPYPPITGKRLRTFKLLIRLARRHRITYFCHRNADPQEARLARMLFHDHNIEPIMVDRAVPAKSGPGFYLRLAANLLSPLPYSVATHRSAQMEAAIHAYAAANPVDVWQCEWTPYAAVLKGLPGVRRLIMAHNVESVIWKRYHQHESNRLRRWYIKKQWRKFEQFEQDAFAQADGVVAVSSEDASMIAAQLGGCQVDVVDNGVDTDYFRPLGNQREAGRILFLGSLDWRPNLDAVRLLVDQVFPIVTRHIGTAKLVIVGRHPPVWLGRLIAGRPNIQLHADVADVRPYLGECGVMAVPLRIGGGSRLKILEALASGLPVVSTRIGAEGLRLMSGQHLTVVEEIGQMGDALVNAIRNPGPALTMAERGRAFVLDSYGWDVLAGKLERIWLRTASASAENALADMRRHSAQVLQQGDGSKRKYGPALRENS
jgi:glycosyltransferase involved in cell wall biosynthesis